MSTAEPRIPGSFTAAHQAILGRAPDFLRVHMRVHTDVTLTDDSYTGGEIIHTGRLFFAPDIGTEARTTSPYAENTTRETQLEDDGIHDDGGASSGPPPLSALGDRVADGHKATLTVSVSSA
ncbi:hypothetical protein [Streptomyces sp. HD]|uniref:hypothetical protein n=1 Tax=Streptomyces sp. HD TaxID=3020892 RepID=UPI00232FA2F1|nr:hypothetical protein [Streptomyces sp. HD]MDC0766024.1 hypothetical protein [Streptomyces sp. HD]